MGNSESGPTIGELISANPAFAAAHSRLLNTLQYGLQTSSSEPFKKFYLFKRRLDKIADARQSLLNASDSTRLSEYLRWVHKIKRNIDPWVQSDSRFFQLTNSLYAVEKSISQTRPTVAQIAAALGIGRRKRQAQRHRRRLRIAKRRRILGSI